jgi:uncharacterized membrane protein (DUF2068 family)
MLGDDDADGAPERTVLGLKTITAVFTAYGSLDAITSFGSVAFLVVFGAMSYLGFRERDNDEITPVVPALGVLGTVAFFPLLLYHLWSAQRQVFYAVVLIAVVGVELLYFEREAVTEGVRSIEKSL